MFSPSERFKQCLKHLALALLLCPVSHRPPIADEVSWEINYLSKGGLSQQPWLHGGHKSTSRDIGGP